MKYSIVKVMVYVTLVLMCSLLCSEINSYADEQKTSEGTADNLKSTIQKQEDTIKQLQAELKKQQEKIDQLSKEQTPPNPVTEALRESWGCGTQRVIEIKEGLVKVYFDDVHDLMHFFETDADKHAYRDLSIFLEKTKLKKGTIEYYSDKKLFSITGGLTDAQTKKYF
jgi:FtsZ-binding cell division protein ZapB